MPEKYVEYAYTYGMDDSEGLAAYVLTEHLRSLDIEFDVYQTALDMTSSAFRLWLVASRAAVDVFGDRGSGGFGARFLQRLSGEPYFTLGLCDRERVIDYLESLEGADKQRLASLCLGWSVVAEKIPGLTTRADVDAYRNVLYDKMAAITKERVKVTVISKDRVIAMAQATGGPGAPLEVRRYKGGTDVNGVTLGECKLHKSGLMIIKKASGAIPAAEKVTEVKNELTGHVVKLKATRDTTPKGEALEVKRVKSGQTLTLTGKDHRKSWVVSVIDAPEEPKPKTETDSS